MQRLSKATHLLLLFLLFFTCLIGGSPYTPPNNNLQGPAPADINLGDRLFNITQKKEALAYIGTLPFATLEEKYDVVGGVVGEGGFSKIITVQKDGQLYALKIIPFKSIVKASYIANEIIIMREITGDSPYLLKVHDVFMIKDRILNIAILMDFVNGMDMVDYIEKRNNNDPLTERQVAHLSHDILNALSVLHAHGVAHLDIKLENIMYDELYDRYILIDYGLAARSGVEGRTRGTVNHFSPEMALLRSSKSLSTKCIYSPAMDIFSLGSSILALVELGNHPNELEEDPVKLIDNILTGRITPTMLHHSFRFSAFLRKMLRMDPKDRDSAQDLLQNAFIRQYYQ